MKKIILGMVIGFLLAGATWLAFVRPRSGAAAAKGEPPKTEAAAPKAEEKPNPLRLPPAKRTAAGIVLVKPTESTLAPEVSAFGRVLDPTPFVALLAEQETARASSIASAKELERVSKLFSAGGNASAQAVETAEANAARDRAAVASAQARLLAGWGRDVAKASESLSKALEDGATLARLDVLAGEPATTTPKVAHLSLPGGTAIFDAEVLGAAPVVDPQVQGESFLVLLKNHPLPAGAALRGTIPGDGEAAKVLVVPRSAVVYHQGSAWAYVLGEEDTFERKLVSLGRSFGDDGVVVAQGLEAAEQVVTTGAEQLLAAELQAGGAPEGD